MPNSPATLTRDHVEAFITELLGHHAPATAHNRYRALRSFFGWLVEQIAYYEIHGDSGDTCTRFPSTPLQA
jgi:site-specific recombinase XerD